MASPRTNIGAPKANQPSRKGKKAWRKNVDIADLQDGLEQVHEEMIQGGVIKEKDDIELFAVDFGGNENILPRELKGAKKLKADEILAQRSVIAPVDSKKRSNPNSLGGSQNAKKKRINGVSNRELKLLRATADRKSSVMTLPKTVSKELYDPWDDKPAPVLEDDPRFDFLEKKRAVKAPPTMKHKPIILATAVDKIPAIRIPDAGQSYNPEAGQWTALIRSEHEKEQEKENARLAARAEEERLAVLAAIPDDELKSDDDEAWEPEEGDDEEQTPRPKVEPKRKTQAQRNREKRQKEEKRERAEKQKAKLQERELLLIKKYAKDAKALEKLQMAKLIAKKTKPADDEGNPKFMRKKRFGKIRLPEPPLVLQLSDELSESLRTLKPEGNLLADRYRSLRERGIVEMRTPVVHAKKVKRSQTEKWSYKDFK